MRRGGRGVEARRREKKGSGDENWKSRDMKCGGQAKKKEAIGPRYKKE